MKETMKNIAALAFISIIFNVLGYLYLFSDLENERNSATIIELDLPDVSPLHQAVSSEYDPAEVYCMAQNIYHEARNQSTEGQYAVAFVTMNRVAHVDFPDTVCEVVFEPFQFSWTLTPVSVNTRNPIERNAWLQSMAISRLVISGEAHNTLPNVTHYHTNGVAPNWGYQIVTVIDDHIFFSRP